MHGTTIDIDDESTEKVVNKTEVKKEAKQERVKEWSGTRPVSCLKFSRPWIAGNLSMALSSTLLVALLRPGNRITTFK